MNWIQEAMQRKALASAAAAAAALEEDNATECIISNWINSESTSCNIDLRCK